MTKIKICGLTRTEDIDMVNDENLSQGYTLGKVLFVVTKSLIKCFIVYSE